jgi:hypothetical protein
MRRSDAADASASVRFGTRPVDGLALVDQAQSPLTQFVGVLLLCTLSTPPAGSAASTAPGTAREHPGYEGHALPAVHAQHRP